MGDTSFLFRFKQFAAHANAWMEWNTLNCSLSNSFIFYFCTESEIRKTRVIPFWSCEWILYCKTRHYLVLSFSVLCYETIEWMIHKFWKTSQIWLKTFCFLIFFIHELIFRCIRIGIYPKSVMVTLNTRPDRHDQLTLSGNSGGGDGFVIFFFTSNQRKKESREKESFLTAEFTYQIWSWYFISVLPLQPIFSPNLLFLSSPLASCAPSLRSSCFPALSADYSGICKHLQDLCGDSSLTLSSCLSITAPCWPSHSCCKTSPPCAGRWIPTRTQMMSP